MSRPRTLPPTPHGLPQVVRVPAADRLSPRGRRAASVLALVLLLAGAAALAASGTPLVTGAERVAGSGDVSGGALDGLGPRTADAGAPVGGDEATDAGTGRDGVMLAAWDGPTTHLDWTGRTYATAEASFVGDRVGAPGDSVERTLTLTNAGPSDAVMSVSLTLGSLVPDDAENPDLEEVVDLHWDVGGVTGSETFATLLSSDDARTEVAQVEVPQGSTVAVRIGFSIPLSVTGAMNQGAESSALELLVTARMQGDSAVAPSPALPQLPRLPVTGAQVLALVALALGLVSLGVLLAALVRRLRRRRVCDGCGERIRRRDGQTVRRSPDGSREVLCAVCEEPGATSARRVVPEPRQA
jgi:hypothetical protein